MKTILLQKKSLTTRKTSIAQTFAATALIALLAQNCPAAFHEWDIAELYSNEDGSVQFIEMFTPFGGQEFLMVIKSGAAAQAERIH